MTIKWAKDLVVLLAGAVEIISCHKDQGPARYLAPCQPVARMQTLDWQRHVTPELILKLPKEYVPLSVRADSNYRERIMRFGAKGRRIQFELGPTADRLEPNQGTHQYTACKALIGGRPAMLAQWTDSGGFFGTTYSIGAFWSGVQGDTDLALIADIADTSYEKEALSVILAAELAAKRPAK